MRNPDHPLEQEIRGVRSHIIGQIDSESTARYTTLSAEASNQLVIVDNETGRSVTVGLCDARGALIALRTLHP